MISLVATQTMFTHSLEAVEDTDPLGEVPLRCMRFSPTFFPHTDRTKSAFFTNESKDSSSSSSPTEFNGESPDVKNHKLNIFKFLTKSYQC